MSTEAWAMRAYQEQELRLGFKREVEAMGQVARWRKGEIAARLAGHRQEFENWRGEDTPESRRLRVAIRELEWVLEVLSRTPESHAGARGGAHG